MYNYVKDYSGLPFFVQGTLTSNKSGFPCAHALVFANSLRESARLKIQVQPMQQARLQRFASRGVWRCGVNATVQQ